MSPPTRTRVSRVILIVHLVLIAIGVGLLILVLRY